LRFTNEFKQQAVRLVLDEDKGVMAVARELDLVPSALGRSGSNRRRPIG
jgi:transposase-like protein